MKEILLPAANFYDNPITALGWQTERWFQICSETVGGFWKNVQGKNPVRINEIYCGTPGSPWSTATNTFNWLLIILAQVDWDIFLLHLL